VIIRILRSAQTAVALAGGVDRIWKRSGALPRNIRWTMLASNRTMPLINPGTVTETARIPQSGTVYGVSYSADGSTLVTSALKAIQFWDLGKIETIESDQLIDAACSRLTINFSKAQWSNFFGDEEFKILCDKLPVP
jgi:WD40 repeat protein